ncbi:LytR/AlgR family response regulator transcription factor [Spirillospora sp. CA-294931]|uniref:LytR/AlgR family response regulator transcription factor n=1 Tax=Spirillospora sp. CA-294931 TaxID=3240042 RepID=UPI003D8C33D0
MPGLRVLAVDDELPVLDDLAFLLRADPRVGVLQTARDGAAALRRVDRALAEDHPIDAVFLDIRMPGLDGVVLGRLLARFARPPRIVYVTAYDDHAVDAFAIEAADYLLKPVRPERLAEAIRRVAEPLTAGPAASRDQVPVELGGVTRFVARSDVLFVEARGDYARLHTLGGSHLVRISLASLEERWRDLGFVRVHRGYLVALQHVDELRVDSGRCTVRVGGARLPVSRRHTRELRDRLVRVPRRAG